MQNDLILNEDLKKLILEDKTLTNYFLITLFHRLEDEGKKPPYYLKEEYTLYENILNEEIETDINKDGKLKEFLLGVYKDTISDTMINDVYEDYLDLSNNEGKQVLYSLSRLLYLQDKYKDDEIGQKIDAKIKEWLTYIKTFDEVKETKDYFKNIVKDTTLTEQERIEKVKAYNREMNARLLYRIIPSLNYDIYNFKNRYPFMSLWGNKATPQDIKDFLTTGINNLLENVNSYRRYQHDISDFLYTIEHDINDINFNRDMAKEQRELREKYNVSLDKDKNYNIPKETQEAFLDDIANLYITYTDKHGFNIQDDDDIKLWRDKAERFINHLEQYNGIASFTVFNLDYTLEYLAYSDYQLKTYKLDIKDDISVKERTPQKIKQEKEQDTRIYQATSKQLKAIDNARGGLVTYNETNRQAIINEIKETEASIKATTIKEDKTKLRNKLKKLKDDLAKATEEETRLKEEYKDVNDYLVKIIQSMANENKTSSYYKDLKRRKKEQEKRKTEIERIITFNGWQIDLEGRGNYELILNKRKKERLKLTVENLSKQIAKYTKEEQDMFDFIISKYLHNTDIKEIKFTLREYEKIKARARADKQLFNDIQAVRLLFREIWTYYTTDANTYSFNEEHLFTRLNIKGELVKDITDLDNANLDTQISLEPTETLQKLLQDHDNYLYISTPQEILKLNNDGEYLAKRLIKYFNYLARVNKSSVIEISLDAIIEELQHYGLKHFNMLDRHDTYKTEIIDVLDKTISVLEGNNRINKAFIEALDLTPFYTYDELYKGKSQETVINEWGKQTIKIKVLNIDDNKLIDIKKKHGKNKKNKTTKNK